MEFLVSNVAFVLHIYTASQRDLHLTAWQAINNASTVTNSNTFYSFQGLESKLGLMTIRQSFIYFAIQCLLKTPPVFESLSAASQRSTCLQHQIGAVIPQSLSLLTQICLPTHTAAGLFWILNAKETKQTTKTSSSVS